MLSLNTAQTVAATTAAGGLLGLGVGLVSRSNHPGPPRLSGNEIGQTIVSTAIFSGFGAFFGHSFAKIAKGGNPPRAAAATAAGVAAFTAAGLLTQGLRDG